MKLIILLTSVFLLSACSSDSGNVPDPQPESTQADPPQSPDVDYSKIQCGNLEECVETCDFEKPKATISGIKDQICKGRLSQSSCSALIDYHNNLYVKGNLWCKSLKVSEIIDPAIIDSATCSSDQSCVNACDSFFLSMSIENDLAIDRRHSASGTFGSTAWAKDRLLNEVAREQKAACLRAPLAHIIN